MPTQSKADQDLEKLLENPTPDKFDLRVQIRNKHGAVVKHQPYRCHVRGDVRYFERPPGSGNLWFGNGEPAGRMEKGEVKTGAEHIAFTPAPLGAEKVAQELTQTQGELAAIKAELEALRSEKQQQAEKLNATIGAQPKTK